MSPVTGWAVALGVFSLCLLAFVGAFIGIREFRKDLLASEGHAQLFGVMSIEGAVVVILCAVFTAGMVYSLQQAVAADAARDAGSGEAREESGGAVDLVEPGETETAAPTPVGTAPIDTVAMVRSLRWPGTTSRTIRRMAADQAGPWTPDRRSRPVQASVLSRNVTGLHSCSRFFGERVERGHRVQLVSALDGMPREPVTALVTDFTFESETCREDLGYQFKMSCALAEQVFSAEVVLCDDGTPRLLGEHVNPLPVRAVYLGATPATP